MTIAKRIFGAVFGALVALAAINSEAQAQATGVGITPGSGVNACVFSVTGTLKAPCVVMVDPVSGATIVTTNGTPATSLLGVQGASNGVPLPVSGTFFQTTQPVSAASLPLPTGAATSALQTTLNSTLGSPFQAGGSIGNTSFAATQATASNLNATVVGTGTFATQLTSWAGGTLGAMATYGTSPGAVLVPGVNANVTNITTKPASTAPLASDPSQVVSISPNVAPSAACSSTAMEVSHICKASAGNLYGFYCNVIGGSAGWCIVYNSATVPATGALTGAQVLDNCQFGAGAMGCSLDRIPIPRAYGTGIVVLVSSGANPFTYTTGVLTAYLSADYQ